MKGGRRRGSLEEGKRKGEESQKKSNIGEGKLDPLLVGGGKIQKGNLKSKVATLT